MAEEKHYAPFLSENYAIKEGIQSDNVWYYSIEELEKGSKLVFPHWKIPENLEKVKHIFLEREQALLDAATKGDVTAYFDALEAYMPSIILVFCADKPVADAVRALLMEKLPKNEAEQLIDLLSIPEKDNYYKQEEYDLITTNDLNAHVKKYEGIYSRYAEKTPYTVEEAKERLSKINKEQFLSDWQEQKKKVRDAIAKAKDLFGKDAPLIDFMQFIIHYRTHRTDVINISAFNLIPTLERIAKERNLTYQQILHCTREEIEGESSLDVIEERLKDYAIALEKGKPRLLTGAESQKIREYMKEEITGVTEIKGTIASKGKIQGTAKVILVTADFPKINPGDILITSMTTPNMMTIMKKAAAFVTDEGGITCHAAIISREMKTPCIIGTKTATRVFKDGDMVEVDAEKGIVKKL